jgi:uncharacterized membrane protein
MAIVVDSNGGPVSDADLSFECSDSVKSSPKKTDRFGFFTATYIPEGKCKIFASNANDTESIDVEVKRGSLNEVKIELNKREINKYYLLIALILILFFIFLIINRRKLFGKETKKNKLKAKAVRKKGAKKGSALRDSNSNISEIKEKRDETTEHQTSLKSNRSQDIIKTLGGKEKVVIQFLLENNNKSNQATVRHATGLPRTTLARLLSMLESRSIIKIEKHGKAVRVSLTDWFLGKD